MGNPDCNEQGQEKAEAGDTANLLCDHLRARLPGLIHRYHEDWQQEHSVWDVVRQNIPTCAAIKVVIGHCKRLQDLRCCGMDDQLFVNDTTRFKPIPEQKHALVGSYLFYTGKHARFIRSGKAYGRQENFGTRIKAHKVGAVKAAESRFYRTYPDQSKTAGAVGQVSGCFQDLTAYMGFAFDKHDNDAIVPLLADIEDGGIIRWSKAGIQLASKLPLGDSLREKQLHIVSYIFEIVDDLMIEPRMNVSDSGSVEAFMMGKGPSKAPK